MTTEILNLMKIRQTLARKSDQYKRLNKTIKKKCGEAKESWLNDKCKEIEELRDKDSKQMHKKIKKMTSSSTHTTTKCIEDKAGNILMEKDEILNRWEEYIGELYDDERGNKPTIQNASIGPNIMKSEVENALKEMKNGKAPGPDGIFVEMVKALDDNGVTKLTKVLNDVYQTTNIPEDLLKSVFVTIPKKQGATKCELFRTISLMSCVTKLLLKIIMKRSRSHLTPMIRKEQCGFVQNSGTANAVFMLRQIGERAIEVQNDIHICFLDYSKAFDCVNPEKLMEILQSTNMDSNDLQIICNLYWDQTAAIRVGKDTSGYKPVKRGVRQGDVLSPRLYNVYSEKAADEIEEEPGVLIGGNNINNIRYADDGAGVATSEARLQNILNKIVEGSKKIGLQINIKKTKCMVISKKKRTPRCNLWIGNEKIEQVSQFNYLGSTINSESKCGTDIKKRIGIAKTAFEKMSNLFLNSRITIKTKLRLLDCYVFSTLTYGCESWTISPPMENKIKAAEMWFYRKILKISWRSHTTNLEVLNRMGTTQKLINLIRFRQLKFLGHIMRKNSIEKDVLLGKIRGSRSQGRARLTLLECISKYTNKTIPELLRMTQDRTQWRSMAVNVLRGHGT